MGDGAVRVTLREGADLAAILDALRALDGVTDVALTDAFALVRFDGAEVPRGVEAAIEGAARRAHAPREHEVEVCYDGEDLDEVASRAGLTREAVIARHAGRAYEVIHLGFLPGFAYLGALDPSLVLPRRATPRARVAAGSVAIAGDRTCVYPVASPGGWHILGRVRAFAPFSVEEGARWSIGDRVRFVAR